MVEDTSREKIVAAAWEVFVESGYAGARMQTIADKAGVNKAMIYYYYKSKDDLFEQIITETFANFFSSFFSGIDVHEMDIVKVIPKFVDAHIDFLAANPNLPKLLLREIHGNNPVIDKVLEKFVNQVLFVVFHKVTTKFGEASNNGYIREVNPMQTIMNIAALNIFYFAVKPISTRMMGLINMKEEEFLTQRKQAITDLLLNGLLPR